MKKHTMCLLQIYVYVYFSYVTVDYYYAYLIKKYNNSLFIFHNKGSQL